MVAAGPRAKVVLLPDSFQEINETFHERGWTDGLPIMPPTEAAVAEMLRWTDRDPREVLAVLPPRQGEATVEKIAINAVMAGCKPRYLPVIIAAVQAVSDPAFNLDAVQATTHPSTPFLVVSGPIADELEINSGYNCFGQGFRANATIGRALRLILMNVGGGLPGTGDRSTQGSPAKFSYCIAENRAANPWEPLHVELGFGADATTVTASACEPPHNIHDGYSFTGEHILRSIAGSMGAAGSNNILLHGHPVLTICPEHAAQLAKDGYDKPAIRRYVFEHARIRMDRLSPEYIAGVVERTGGFDPADPNAECLILDRPEDMVIVVAGGPGKHTSWQPTQGKGTHTVTVAIGRADGTPVRSVEELHRS